jgi:capsular exopolysaccharide synthesis family protein
MSKIFNVIKKDTLIDIGDVYEMQADVVGDIQTLAEQPKSTVSLSRPNAFGRIAHLRVSALSPIFPFDTGHHAAADQYRIIRTKLLHHPRKPHVIVVSSASSGDGKTITSINVAASLALKPDARVLLVDGDLRRPCIADSLGIPREPGLAQVLDGSSSFESAVMRVEQIPNLFLLPAGGAPPDTAELLEGRNWHLFLRQIREQFSNVVFDAPPVATVADYELLQLACDAVVMVARPDHTDRTACMKALQTVPREKLLGIVLNAVENWWLWKSPGYAYSPKASPKSSD